MEVGIDIVKIPRMEGKEDLAKKILSDGGWKDSDNDGICALSKKNG